MGIPVLSASAVLVDIKLTHGHEAGLDWFLEPCCAAAIRVIGGALTLLPFVVLSSALDSSWQKQHVELCAEFK